MVAAAMQARDESMAHEYKPAPESKTPLSLRVPVSLRRKLEVMVRLWKAQATARGEDPTNVDMTHVCTELLKDSVASAFDQYGGLPADEAAVKKVEQSILSAVSSAHKK